MIKRRIVALLLIISLISICTGAFASEETSGDYIDYITADTTEGKDVNLSSTKQDDQSVMLTSSLTWWWR